MTRDLKAASGRSQRLGSDPPAAALALTFDNLGETADEPAVAVALPALLDRLDELGLRATFCVEAVNCELHPGPVREIGARGHELAHHGWRHEHWADLDQRSERELLERGLAAFARLGIDVSGFRPPGGRLAPSSEQTLAELGFRWCSPAGDEPLVAAGGLVVLPFRWPLVDAYHLMPSVRARGGGPPGGGVHTLAAAFAAELARLAGEGGLATAIFHPFLRLDGQQEAALDDLLERIAALAARGAFVGPAGELADALR